MKKIIKILLIISLLLNTFCLFVNNVFAATVYTATVNDKEGVYIRSGPGTNNSRIALLTYGSTVTLVSTDKYQGTGCDDGWYQVNYANSTDRYLCSSFVAVTGNSVSENGVYYATSTFNTRIIEDYANVRKAASASSAVIERIFLGTEVTVLGESGSWYHISYYDGRTGYVLKKLCKKYEEITKTDDTEYNKILQEAGFPESYWPFLSYLHSLHPNWIFIADNTKKDFKTAITAEVGKNYIPSTIDAFRTDNIPKEGVYYTASSGVVAVFMDPRNYLNESSIFAFEALSYNEENHTSEVVKNIFSGSYLADDSYVNMFINAGKTYNVSPVHLASRAKQEGATNENYDSISGTSNLTYNGTSLNGYYNYYNIGAFGTTPVTRGLAVAAGLISYGIDGAPWDTREKAITYGAKWIADGYISKGQDTMYYQKFNTKNGAAYAAYTHQYMTNILAPASESLSTYQSYSSLDLLNIAYTFYIPVYNNMPEEFTTMPPIGDTNNDLSDIKINGTSITGFDSDVLEYTSYVPYDTTEIELLATAASTNSSIVGNGTITLSETEQETVIEIIVTSQTGNAKTYKINVIKQEKPAEEEKTYLTPEEITNKMDIKFSNGYMTYINIGTTATALINEAKKAEPTAEVTVKSAEGNNKTNEALATGDVITITSNEITQEYTIAIKGDVNGDGKISAVDYLRVQKHILKYITFTGAFKEASDINYDDKISAVDYLRVQKHILKYIVIR